MTDVGTSPPGEPARGEDEAARGATVGPARRRAFGRWRTGSGAYGPLAAAVGLAIAVGSVGAAVGLHSRLASGPGAGGDTPPARSGAAMAFDADHGVVVMFGGVDQNHRSLGDTWTWDGSRWTQQHPRTSPPPRQQAAMVWDAARHRIVLAGGVDLTWLTTNAHITVNGSATAVAGVSGGSHVAIGHMAIGVATMPPGGAVKPVPCPSSTPPTNRNGGGAMVECAQVTPCRVAPASSAPPSAAPGPITCPQPPCAPFAGCTSITPPSAIGPTLGDTWTWDGTDWTEQHPAHHPEGRLSAAFDAATGRIVAVTLDAVLPYRGGPLPEPLPACGAVVPSGGTGSCAARATSCVSVGAPPAASHLPVPAPPSPCPSMVATGDVTLGRTWTWDGHDWTAQPLTVGPPISSLLATDPATGRAVAVHFSLPCVAVPMEGSGPPAVAGVGGAGMAPASPPGGGARPIAIATPSGAPTVAKPLEPTHLNPCIEVETGVPPASLLPTPHTTVVAPPSRVVEWTGSAWRDTGAPGPASLPTGVLVGEMANRTLVLQDGPTTWVRSGAAWASHGPAGLPARSGAAMAYDAARHTVVLFGGQVSGRSASGALVSVSLDDTWTWDGTRWTKQAGGPVPALRPSVARPVITPGKPTVTLLPAPQPVPPVPACLSAPPSPRSTSPCPSPPGAPPTLPLVPPRG